MTDHIGLDVLAALDEGLLDRRTAKKTRLHLADCPVCAARESGIAEIPAVLRRIGEAEPPPTPAWVATRLDAALAAEAGSDGTAPGGEPDRVPSIGDAPRRRRRPPGSVLLRPVAAAAAVCLLAGGGYALYRATASSGGGSPTAARPSARTAATAPTRGGPLLEPGARAPAAGLPRVVRSGTNFQPGQLQAQVEYVLRQAAGESHAPAGVGNASATLPAGLEGCLQRIAYGQQAALVDEASYRGQPATIFVVPQPNGPGGRVWVTGSGCSAARADVLAQTSISSIP
jgi:hypothetical protein